MQKQVREFHRDVLGGLTSPAEPVLRTPELQARLIAEEASETVYAMVGDARAREILSEYSFPHPHHVRSATEHDLLATIDGLVDLIYVALGAAEDIGIDLEPFWEEVHSANMRKVDVGKQQRTSQTPLGKCIKPEGWKGPDLKSVLERVRNEWRKSKGLPVREETEA